MANLLFSNSYSKVKTWPNSILKNKNGAVLVWVALMVTCLIAFLALAVDVGYMYVTRNELQNVADAAALAGANELGRKYLLLDPSAQEGYDVSSDAASIRQAAKDVAKKNKAASVDIEIKDSDIIIGQWNWVKNAAKPNPNPTNIEPDAVQVTSYRAADYAGGAVATFFARILNLFGGNHDFFEASAVATAALSGPSQLAEGELITPVGLSIKNFPFNCDKLVTFKDTKDSCAGWHNFFDPKDPADVIPKWFNLIASDLGGKAWLNKYFPKMDLSKYSGSTTPATEINDSYIFTGGVVATLFNGDQIEWTGDKKNIPTGNYLDANGTIIKNPKLKDPAPFAALFDYFRMHDGDGDDSKWTATVPVYYDGSTCSNPSNATKLAGFAVIEILGYTPPPDSTINVFVNCSLNKIDEGRGGGGKFGNLKGSIPNLVE